MKTFATYYADDYSASSLRQIADHAKAAARHADLMTEAEAKAFADLAKAIEAVLALQSPRA